MKKAGFAFLAYCAITVALTYPLILRIGSVLPNDAGDLTLDLSGRWTRDGAEGTEQSEQDARAHGTAYR